MESVLWQIALVASKLIFYFSATLLLAEFFLRREKQRKTISPVLWGSLSIFALPITLFSTVGYMNESGWAGLIDEFMISLLWEDDLGTALMLKGVSVALVLLALVLQNESSTFKYANALGLAGLIVFGLSFAASGHINSRGAFEQAAISFHAMFALWWSAWVITFIKMAGITNTPDEVLLYRSCLERFGHRAMLNVLILIGCGAFLLIGLVTPLSSILEATYGWVLLAKIFLTVLVLLLAARHKWLLVPKLSTLTEMHRIKRSIRTEFILIAIVIAVATTLATALSP